MSIKRQIVNEKTCANLVACLSFSARVCSMYWLIWHGLPHKAVSDCWLCIVDYTYVYCKSSAENELQLMSFHVACVGMNEFSMIVIRSFCVHNFPLSCIVFTRPEFTVIMQMAIMQLHLDILIKNIIFFEFMDYIWKKKS